MITEVQKYRAQLFQISGFSLITPIGKLILDFLNLKQTDISLKFFIYIVTAILLAFIGLVLILHGMTILEERREGWIP